ncbi:MAG TPA: proteasome-type protease [Aromatoleum sp.]|uniref:proteasome-type protease n=1 Tax=Aromatoleum sp. TaxID=2307007 RepID=UPI002B48462F|nr:proteasome-type protease [Aromatoleum sp.]HJV26327.1 proteasome-type protease [Aromatoleum sp.]
MTYCVGMCLQAGLVFLSDSRTNAGVDHINTFRKMRTWQRPGERVIVMLTSGNLSISQSVGNILTERLALADSTNLFKAPNMFEVARHVGEVMREVHRRDAEALSEFGVEFNASMVVGGQILGEGPRLFNVYAAGNFIESTEDTPYIQIGESKYGKPIIDRVVKYGTSLSDAAKCALVSMDSTIRSNLSVGLPLDLCVVERDALAIKSHVSITFENAYYQQIRSQWGERLREAFAELPNPDWV